MLGAHEGILAAMRRGSALAVTQTIETGGTQTVVYSTRGLTAAMTWIDRVQGRSGETPIIGVPMSLQEIVPGYQP